VPYTPEVAIEFWFAFDDHFLFHATAEVTNAYGIIRGPDYILNKWRQHRRLGTYPDGFLTDVMPLRAGLDTLSTEQLAMMDQHFGRDAEIMRRSFEDFAQGILFDNRRDVGNKVHMMDTSGPANPPIGYHRWYTIARAMVVCGIEATRWTEIISFVALAWAIQSEAKPVQDEHNSPMDATRLQALRDAWLPRNLDTLDQNFDHSPYPPLV
jgi:hypothetical protein